MTEDTKAATVEIRKDGELLASARHCEMAGMSVEVGPSFETSVRVWFDSMDEQGNLMRDGRRVGSIRRNLLDPIRTAMEAAIWEAYTGDVSGVCDGTDEWTDVSYVNMGDM